jgi:dihydrofolate reductase
MGTVCLYYGCSMDGYIEGENHDLSWLPDGEDFVDYSGFIKSVDATVMGRNTLETILGFGVEWPYPNSENFLISKSPAPQNVPIQNITGSLTEFLTRLKMKHNGRIWIVGGPMLHTELLERNLVDEIILTIIPALVGNGVPLVKQPGFKTQKWILKELISFGERGFQSVYVPEKRQ